MHFLPPRKQPLFASWVVGETGKKNSHPKIYLTKVFYKFLEADVRLLLGMIPFLNPTRSHKVTQICPIPMDVFGCQKRRCQNWQINPQSWIQGVHDQGWAVHHRKISETSQLTKRDQKKELPPKKTPKDTP